MINIILFIILGSVKLLLLKYIDRNGLDIITLQALVLFFGEFLCGIWYLILNKCKVKYHKDTSYLLISTLCDVISSLLLYQGITMVSLSDYQFTKSIIIPITMLFSYMFFGRRYMLLHVISVFFILCGIYLSSHSIHDNHSENHIGIFYIIIAQIFGASQLIFEEMIIKHWENPMPFLYISGIQGIIGIIVILSGMVLMNKMSDFEKAYNIISNDNKYIPIILTIVSTITIDSYLALTITSMYSANYRTIIDIFRMIIISIMSVYFGFEDKFNTEKSISFIIIIIGLLIYTNIKKEPLNNESEYHIIEYSDDSYYSNMNDSRSSDFNNSDFNSESNNSESESNFMVGHGVDIENGINTEPLLNNQQAL